MAFSISSHRITAFFQRMNPAGMAGFALIAALMGFCLSAAAMQQLSGNFRATHGERNRQQLSPRCSAVTSIGIAGWSEDA